MGEVKVEKGVKKEPIINIGCPIALATYEAVGKFKSVRRAIKRGHVSPDGVIYPKRPFGNTNTKENMIKRQIYEQLKNRRRVP